VDEEEEENLKWGVIINMVDEVVEDYLLKNMVVITIICNTAVILM
jgi:hypothetical protein